MSPVPIMSANQFEKALADLDINQTQAAELLGVDDRTIRRWISNERDVPGPVVRFLKYLIATGKSGASAIKKLEPKK